MSRQEEQVFNFLAGIVVLVGLGLALLLAF
jgi:hypothetical protein